MLRFLAPVMRWLAMAFPLVLALLAGCSDADGEEPEVRLITPGAWNVRSDADHVFAWVRNTGSVGVTGSWSVAGKGGAALPEGWHLVFHTPSFTLEPEGTKVADPRGRTTYPDLASTLITLHLPAGTPAGAHELELRAGDAVSGFTLTVEEARAAVSGPGSRVTVGYEGRFTDSGEVFDDGEFPTRLGSGQTVPGFDYGLMGLAVGETAEIVLPPALAYGFDNPPGSHEKFNGESLTFKVTMKSIQ